jgi:NACalpha-BTF3-like transcription factor
MSREVDQRSVLTPESSEADAAAADMVSHIIEEEKKPELTIRASDLKMVQTATRLDRNAAIELIQSTDGDIKAALRLYVTG